MRGDFTAWRRPALVITAVSAGALGTACATGPEIASASGACSQIESLHVPSQPDGGLEPGPHTVVWGGVRFWYCVSGSADALRSPVVFVHGGPGEGSQHFAALTGPRLETDALVVYFDQRGSGRSERPWRREYAIATLVEDLEQLRIALGVEQVSLIGHSFGALLALEYAATYPDRAASLILVSGLSDLPATGRSVCSRLEAIDPAAFARAMESPTASGVCNSFAAYLGEESERFARESMYPNPRVGELVDSLDRVDGLRNTGEIGRFLFAQADLLSYRFEGHDRVAMPVLVVAGREDHQIGFTPQEALAQALPDAELLVIENGGHFPHVDDPSEFSAAVLTFLREARR